MTVRRLLDEADSCELAEWMAYAALEGLPESRADYRSGQVCATLANVHRQAGVDPFSPADFVPRDIADDDDDVEVDSAGVDDAVLLPDPEAHSRLIMAAVFGIVPVENTVPVS